MQKKCQSDLTVLSNSQLNDSFFLLRLRIDGDRPGIRPGQFVEIRVKDTQGVFLRRPISVHDYNPDAKVLELLVRKVGRGTVALSQSKPGDRVDAIFPLGNGFDLSKAGKTPLLVGGGVGVAPLFYLAKELIREGAKPTFLFGTRTIGDLLRKDDFEKIAQVDITTEDGSAGTRGFVTDHADLSAETICKYSSILQCGPTPMMRAVANKAQDAGVDCYASLENKMACGFGVCLCCVADTANGNMRVCADGPVFNVKELKW